MDGAVGRGKRLVALSPGHRTDLKWCVRFGIFFRDWMKAVGGKCLETGNKIQLQNIVCK